MATSNNEIEERLAYLDNILPSGTDEEVGEMAHQLLGSPPPLPVTIVRAAGMRHMFISTSEDARIVTTTLQYDTLGRPPSPILRALLTEDEAETTESEEAEDIPRSPRVNASPELKTK